MNEEDRIEIIAILRDRFSDNADKINRKLEEMEHQAEETGDSIDDLTESIDDESKATKDSTNTTEKNTRARSVNRDAVTNQVSEVKSSTSALDNESRSLRKSTDHVRMHSEAVESSTDAHSTFSRVVGTAARSADDAGNETREWTAALKDNTRATRRAADSLNALFDTIKDGESTTRDHTKATEENTRATEKNRKAVDKDTDSWSRWDKKLKRITSGFASRFKPIGAFYQNYFKILGAIRGLLFSDIGAAIPQLITAFTSLGAAAVASLAPIGRLAGSLGLMVPAMLAIQQMKGVVALAFSGVGEALKVMNKANATAEETAAAMEAAGEHGWAFAEALKEIQDDFKPIQRQVQQTFLDGLGPALQQMTNTYFPLLEEHLTETARIMNGELKEGLERLQTPGRKDSIDRVMARSAEASGIMTEALFTLLDIFVELADAAGPAFLDSLQGISDKLAEFSDWVRDNKAEVTDFFDRSAETAGNVAKGIGYIAWGLYGLAQGAKPLEDFLYGDLLSRLQEWSEKMNDPAHIAEMSENYENMIPNLEALGNAIGAVVDGFKEIADSPYFADLMNSLADDGIPTLIDLFKQLDEEVSPALVRISDALGEIDPEVTTSVLAPLGDALSILASVLEIVVPLFEKLPEPMQKATMYGIGLIGMGLPTFFLASLAGLKPLVKLFDAFKWAIQKAAGALVDLGESKFASKLGAAFGVIKEFVKKWAPKLAKALGPILRFLGTKTIAVVPVIGTVIAILWTLWDVIKWLWDNVEPFREFIIGIWDKVKEAWDASITWIKDTAVPWVVDAFQTIWDKIKEVGQGIANFYDQWIKPIIDGIVWLGKLIFVVVSTMIIAPFQIAWNIIGPILEDIVTWFQEKIPVALNALKLIWDTVWTAISTTASIIWTGLKTGWDVLWTSITTVASTVWGWLTSTWNILWTTLYAVASTVWGWLKIGWGILMAAFEWGRLIISTVVGAIVGAFLWMRDRVTAAWGWIKNNVINPFVTWFMVTVWPILKMVIDWISNKFNWLKDKIGIAFGWIKNQIIGPTSTWFRDTIWPRFRNVLNWLKDKFYWVRDRISNAWDAIKNKISDVYYNNIEPVIDRFKDALRTLANSFKTARDNIGKYWSGVKEKVRGPIQYVVDVVYNNGIRKVWNELADKVELGVKLNPISMGTGNKSSNASQRSSNGGVGSGRSTAYDTGGWTGPGSKYQEAGIVHADEYVIRKVSQRSLRREAPGFLDLLNKFGSKALGMYGVPGYFGGGHVGSGVKTRGYDGGGDVKVADGDGKTWDWTNPFKGMAENWTNKLASKFPSSGKFATDLGGGIIKKLVGAASSFAKNKIQAGAMFFANGVKGAAGAVGGALAGFKGSARGWARASAAARQYGLRLTSGLRRGARTAGSGSVSLHALGRARDYSNSSGPTPQMMAFFNAMDTAPYPTELLYSPAGSRNIHRGGRRYANTGVTRRIHYNHVHVGFHKGGLARFDHMRFMGGPVETWGNTLVGEFGPEIFLPSNGGFPSMLGMNGPEVVSFNREGSVLPHTAVAEMAEAMHTNTAVADRPSGDTHYHIDLDINGGSPQDKNSIKSAIKQAIAEIEREKKERS